MCVKFNYRILSIQLHCIILTLFIVSKIPQLGGLGLGSYTVTNVDCKCTFLCRQVPNIIRLNNSICLKSQTISVNKFVTIFMTISSFLFAFVTFVYYFSIIVSFKNGNVMEHSEIIDKLAERLQITPKESKRLIRALVKLFTEKLGKNHKFSIPGFGTFGTRIRKERKAYNPATKSIQLFPKKNVVYFRPAARLKKSMKNQEVK